MIELASRTWVSALRRTAKPARAQRIVVTLLAAGVLAMATTATVAQGLPRYAEVRAAYRPSDLTLLDRHGVPIQTLRVDREVRRLPWVALDEMSPALLQAVVLSEDRGFWEHSGVDWGAAARSAFANLWNTRTRGASTVTMQLAGLLDSDLSRPAAGRSTWTKLDQAWAASQLEKRWKKSEILEAYLNLVPWRGELVGVNALAQTLFGKHPSGLDAQEGAIAAALLRGPNATTDGVVRRTCVVLKEQQRACAGAEALATMALQRRGGMPLGEQIAPHAVRQVLAEMKAQTALQTTAQKATSGSAQIPSTLDASVQRVAIAALRRHLEELRGRNVEDGAVVVLDNASGEVLAWVGSSGGLSDAAQVDGVLARRQAGSTLKPFVYAMAFERKLITPATLLDDSPAQLATGNGLYLPRNYDATHRGWVSARMALASSLNVPAVRVGAMLGADALAERLQAHGILLEHGAGWYGASLALGSAEVTLLELTNAYRSLANGGLGSAPRLVSWVGKARPRETMGEKANEKSGERASQRAVGADAAFLVSDILADNGARALTFGLDSALVTRGYAAVKTGTSKDMRDNWCVGSTDRYTVGVWVGNASGEAMHDVSGTSGAAPVWRALMEHLHAGQPSQPPKPPSSLHRQRVLLAGGREPARDEWFIAGTEAGLGAGGDHRHGDPPPSRAFGIRSPRDGSVFALDPDMPPAAQRLRFEGEAGVWVLDGRRLGRGATMLWSPWPGRHELQLQAADGRVVQSVRFEVRGATVRPIRPVALR